MNLATKFALGIFISFALMFAGCDDDDRTTNIFGPMCDGLVVVGKSEAQPQCVEIHCDELARFLEDGWTHYYDEPTCKAALNDDEDEWSDE